MMTSTKLAVERRHSRIKDFNVAIRAWRVRFRTRPVHNAVAKSVRATLHSRRILFAGSLDENPVPLTHVSLCELLAPLPKESIYFRNTAKLDILGNIIS